MAYSTKVLDHYNNPRNVGSFSQQDPNVGTGLVGAPECGDVLKLQILVNPETGMIEDAKFKTFGCGSAIASSSLATEWLRGKTIDEAMGVDLMSLSAHKIYGPKGVGALYVRRQNPYVRLEPIIDGGGHERGLRSGTLPVPLIVGFGEACAIGQEEMAGEAERLIGLRERLRTSIVEQLDQVYVNGHPTERLAGNLNVSFAGVKGEALMMRLKNIAISSGSACTSANPEPSYVLRACGVSDELAHSSIRFGLGRFTTPEEIDYVAAEVVRAVEYLRSINPMYAIEQAADGLADPKSTVPARP